MIIGIGGIIEETNLGVGPKESWEVAKDWMIKNRPFMPPHMVAQLHHEEMHLGMM